MRTDVTLEGADELVRNLKQFGINAERELRNIVNSTAQEVRTNAVRAIQRGPAGGRVYELYTPRRTHQAAAPGQPPMTDTGALASSVAAVVNGLDARVGTGLAYGRHQEFGTRNMLARPWLFPSAEKARPNYERKLNALARAAARGIN